MFDGSFKPRDDKRPQRKWHVVITGQVDDVTAFLEHVDTNLFSGKLDESVVIELTGDDDECQVILCVQPTNHHQEELANLLLSEAQGFAHQLHAQLQEGFYKCRRHRL